MSRSGLRWQCHTFPVGMQLINSIAPISTMRWPEAGSSPVVSVSSTISRRSFVPWFLEVPQPLHDAALAAPERNKNLIDLPPHVCKRRSRVHNVVGTGALLVVGELPPKQRVELRRAHVGAGKHTRPLHIFRGADHDSDVDTRMGIGLEQKRDLE